MEQAFCSIKEIKSLKSFVNQLKQFFVTSSTKNSHLENKTVYDIGFCSSLVSSFFFCLQMESPKIMTVK